MAQVIAAVSCSAFPFLHQPLAIPEKMLDPSATIYGPPTSQSGTGDLALGRGPWEGDPKRSGSPWVDNGPPVSFGNTTRLPYLFVKFDIPPFTVSQPPQGSKVPCARITLLVLLGSYCLLQLAVWLFMRLLELPSLFPATEHTKLPSAESDSGGLVFCDLEQLLYAQAFCITCQLRTYNRKCWGLCLGLAAC